VNEVVAFSEGESLLKYVESIEAGQADCPEMLLLDINLPRYSGTEILERFRLGRCTEVPAIVITSSDSPRDRAEAARLGVLHYFRKPQDYDEFMKIGGIVRNALRAK
jgi:chemotaxis family two-component system response regulator Rcp1